MKTILPVPAPKPPPRKSNPERGLLGMPTRPSFHPTRPSIHPTRPEILVSRPSIRLSGADVEEVAEQQTLPATIVRGTTAVNDITPLHARSAVSSEEATVIVQQSDEDFRARVAAEVTFLVRQALASMRPPPPRADHGASVRWLLVGLVFGALFVYVLMAGTLREKEASLAQAKNAAHSSSITQLAPPTTTNNVIVPKKSDGMMCSATGESLASAIPTFDVDNLPKVPAPKMSIRWHAPKKAAAKTAPAAASSNLDEENPYNAASEENPYANVTQE